MMFKSLTIATLTTIFASRVTAYIPSDCSRAPYWVQPGRAWCDMICAEANVSEYQLTLINTEIDENCDNLRGGEVFCLGRKGQDCTDTYVVKEDDTCGTIASNANIDIDTLLKNNPNVGPDCDGIKESMVLCTAKDIIPYTPNPQ